MRGDGSRPPGAGDRPRPPDGDLAGFTGNDARRTARMVRYVEKALRQPSPGRNRYPIGTGGGAGLRKVKITSSSITARSGTTPGTGTFVDVTFNGTSFVEGTATGTVKSIYTRTLSSTSGKYAWVVYDEGTYWLVTLDC